MTGVDGGVEKMSPVRVMLLEGAYYIFVISLGDGG